MQYLKTKTGKTIHWQEQGAEATAGVCVCGKAGLERVELGKAEYMIAEGKGSYCPAAKRAADDFMGPITQEKPDAKANPGLLAAFLDRMAARQEIVDRKRAARKALKDDEQAHKLGLEKGDRVIGVLPNRTHMRQRIDVGTNAVRNGKIKGRPAARRKAAASIWTHRAYVTRFGVMYRFPLGAQEQAVPARQRDRVALGGKSGQR